MKIEFMDNGNTMAFENGQQVPELQESWLMLYVRHAESQGYDPTTFEITLPDGSSAQIVKTEDGYNYRVF